jgi:hypothetical protein
MLFADVSDRNIFTLAIPNRHTEYALDQENPLRVMAQGTMRKFASIAFDSSNYWWIGR